VYCVCAVFGILKGRFRLLKTPVLYHKKVHVDNIFFTCCALHNQLHAWDQREQWENGMEWGAADGLFEDDPDPNYAKPTIRDVRARGLAAAPRQVDLDDDFSSIGFMSFDSSLGVLLGTPVSDPSALDLDSLVSLHTEIEGSGFEDLQTKLVANFAWKKAHNQIHWLRS